MKWIYRIIVPNQTLRLDGTQCNTGGLHCYAGHRHTFAQYSNALQGGTDEPPPDDDLNQLLAAGRNGRG